MRRFTLLSGRRVVGAWWLFALLGAFTAALCPEPATTVISGITAFVLVLWWLVGYPLLLVASLNQRARNAASEAVERKIYEQFTCLGLGW